MKYSQHETEMLGTYEALPASYIQMALECALADERGDRLIPNDKVLEVLHKKMGWK